MRPSKLCQAAAAAAGTAPAQATAKRRSHRTVKFFPYAVLVPIPCVREFIEAGIHGDIWYSRSELKAFRRRAEFEWREWQRFLQAYARAAEGEFFEESHCFQTDSKPLIVSQCSSSTTRAKTLRCRTRMDSSSNINRLEENALC